MKLNNNKVKSSPLLLVFLVALLAACNQSQTNVNPLILSYDQPASIWEEALPLGNGKTGAMVFGGIHTERYQLNDNTLWSGAPVPGNQPNGPAILEEVRKAVDNEEYGTAGEAWKRMHGPYSARYLPLGDLLVEFNHQDSVPAIYNRDLDLNNALATVKYNIDGVEYLRESFISYPDRALAIKYISNKKGSVSFQAVLSSKLNYTIEGGENSTLILKGKAPEYVAHRKQEPRQVAYADSWAGEGTNFEARLFVDAEGGEVIIEDNKIKVNNANSAVLYLVTATSFNGFDKSPGLKGKDPSKEASLNLSNAIQKGFELIKKDHINDHRQLFNRVSFKLGSDPDTLDLPTDERMIRYNQGLADNHLIELYFQFGRYLMIAGSRPGSQALNLQGIWNDHVQPPWGSNYTTNINTEMNYWPADLTNLSECHGSLFDLMKGLSVNGAVTAKTNYGIERGWCAHHNADIWAKTSPAGGEQWDKGGNPRWSCWPMAGGWFARHPWEHFLYTGDTAFLKTIGWPLMKGAAEFMLDWLIEDESGYLVTNPSTSPENIFKIDGVTYEVSKATTMDMSIVKDLFLNSIQAAKILNTDAELVKEMEEAYVKLYPFQIGKYGQLQEWYKDWDDPKDDHRHLSHLYGLYPANLIVPRNSPELAIAAKQSLVHRGDVSTGWSMAWKINWWARLGDGDHALKILKSGLNYIGPKKETRGYGGTYPNLFDAHPPFQIDGNFGGTAGIAEMLVQSHAGEIELLPALPTEWSEGEVSGLKTRGNFEVDIKWIGGMPKEIKVMSNSGGNCRIRSSIPLEVKSSEFKKAAGKNPNPFFNIPEPPQYKAVQLIDDAKVSVLELREGYVIDFMTEKGKEYVLVPLK